MKQRVLWIDIIRVISMIGVIIIHVVGNTINTLNLSGNPKEVFDAIARVCYFALPLFVLISGMLFLDRDIKIKDLYGKYIKRILIVILLFGSIFSGLEIFFSTHKVTIDYLPKTIYNILTGNLWAHMWYLYMILGLYIITPLLRTWVKNNDMKNQKYMLIVLYLFTVLIPTINDFFDISLAFYLPIYSGFVFVYLLGYYIYKNNQNNLERKIIYIIGAISLLIMIFNPILTSKYIIGYTSTSTIMLATSIFVFFKNHKLKLSNKFENIIINLGTASFGIYILHQFYINIIYKLLKIDIILSYPYLGLVMYSFVILLVTYITVYLLRKIPVVKKYLF